MLDQVCGNVCGHLIITTRCVCWTTIFKMIGPLCFYYSFHFSFQSFTDFAHADIRALVRLRMLTRRCDAQFIPKVYSVVEVRAFCRSFISKPVFIDLALCIEELSCWNISGLGSLYQWRKIMLGCTKILYKTILMNPWTQVKNVQCSSVPFLKNLQELCTIMSTESQRNGSNILWNSCYKVLRVYFEQMEALPRIGIAILIKVYFCVPDVN